MGGERAPWTARLYEMLDDGEWHSFDKVLLEMMKIITPGPASRRAEESRARQQNAATARARNKTIEDQVRIGKRNIAMSSITAGIKRVLLEIERDETGRMVKIRLAERLRDYYTAEEMAGFLNRSTSTTSGWLRNPSVLAEVSKHLPDGIEPVKAFSEKNILAPKAALDAWLFVNARHAVISRPTDEAAALSEAVGKALGITDPREQMATTLRLKDELRKVGRAIYKRSPAH